MALIKLNTRSIPDDAVTPAKVSQDLGRRNLIINGAMAVQQRGTSSVTSGYFVDRFRLSGCSASAVITSNTPTDFPTAITVSATSGNPIVTQRIESKNVQHLSGKVVTASFFAKNVSNATTLYVSLQYAGSADSFGSTTTITEHNLGSLTSDWVKYTASWTVPSGGLNGLALNILCAGSSTFTMGVTGVQLEVGSSATDFEYRPIAEELALCQRYYERIDPPDRQQGKIHNSGNTQMHFILPYKVQKRTTPSVIGSKCNVSQIYDGTSSYTGGISSYDSDGISDWAVTFRVNTSASVGSGAIYRNISGYTLRCDVDAEL